MSSMAEIAARGIGPGTCLRVWGEIRERNDGILPEGCGWPGAGMEYRLLRQGHGAKEAGKQPELTAPENAVEQLEHSRSIAEWTDKMLRECTPQQRVAVFLRYVRGKCYADIAAQMTEGVAVTIPDVERFLEAARLRLRRALDALCPMVDAA